MLFQEEADEEVDVLGEQTQTQTEASEAAEEEGELEPEEGNGDAVRGVALLSG